MICGLLTNCLIANFMIAKENGMDRPGLESVQE